MWFFEDTEYTQDVQEAVSTECGVSLRALPWAGSVLLLPLFMSWEGRDLAEGEFYLPSWILILKRKPMLLPEVSKNMALKDGNRVMPLD